MPSKLNFFKLFLVINVWTAEENQNKVKIRRNSQQQLTPEPSNPNIAKASIQKFGNGKVAAKVTPLGHEGKYTPSTSVLPNIAHRFVNSSTSNDHLGFGSNPIYSNDNRGTLSIQYLNKMVDDESVYRRSSSQSATNSLPPHSSMNNNSHGNYVDIDAIDQIRNQLDYSQYGQNFERNYSMNQNHPHTIDNQISNFAAMRNYSGNNLSEMSSFKKKQYSLRNTGNQSPMSSPNTSQPQLTQYSKLSPVGVSAGTIGYNSDGSPIYENQPNPARSESPIYSNTTSSLSVYHPDNKSSGNHSSNSIYQNSVG